MIKKWFFCVRKTDNKHDECLVAQEQLHPMCAQRVDGAAMPTCHSLAEMCREEVGCRYFSTNDAPRTGFNRVNRLLQGETGTLRAVVRRGQRDQKVRRPAGRVPQGDAWHPGHQSQVKLRLQGHRFLATLWLPWMAETAVGQPLRGYVQRFTLHITWILPKLDSYNLVLLILILY